MKPSCYMLADRRTWGSKQSLFANLRTRLDGICSGRHDCFSEFQTMASTCPKSWMSSSSFEAISTRYKLVPYISWMQYPVQLTRVIILLYSRKLHDTARTHVTWKGMTVATLASGVQGIRTVLSATSTRLQPLTFYSHSRHHTKGKRTVGRLLSCKSTAPKGNIKSSVFPVDS
jgi:hypothetical protein